MSYTEVAISDYNASPPTDDGASGATNTITWAKIKTKLGDPINTAIASVDDNVASACNSLDSSIATLESTVTTLDGLLTTAQSSLYAPSGTAMPFVQTSAPTGWTKVTTYNDYALRLTTGTPSTGGSTAFTSVFTSRTITTTLMPAHTHTMSDSSSSITLSNSSFSTSLNTGTAGAASGVANNAKSDAQLTGGHSVTATITHSGTTGSAGGADAMDFAIQYVDIILATRN